MTTLKGACHCGAVTFEADTPPEPAKRCNCSLCRRRGAVMSPPFLADALRILSGESDLVLYQFNTRTAKHFFCRHCGIYTFHQTRSNPAEWRVNLGCVEGLDAYALSSAIADGASSSVISGA
ncbi:glutathione-dependent formaldehyde-activating protein [Caballeronia hypogeia]|uniref:Glutathione-dependent formaldehyde-activating protein n=1 Tax=Caballeronia hypogeia TaxID=1777140 RepID=A0A157ZH12_9BURK|nr:GFA family protein [Caballeronia hypogeia]SAK44783.1 glutathione-dependent formaldehyde-activating protein [Caballeronia hypogeia]